MLRHLEYVGTLSKDTLNSLLDISSKSLVSGLLIGGFVGYRYKDNLKSLVEKSSNLLCSSKDKKGCNKCQCKCISVEEKLAELDKDLKNEVIE